MQRIRKAVAVTGKYTDKNGQERSQYCNCGSLFKRDDGSICLKLDSLPLGDFNGWISFYDLDDDKKAEKKPEPEKQHPQALDDDIPF